MSYYLFHSIQITNRSIRYHSSATLLPDGSVFISGSNPHQDVNLEAIFPTEYAVERFYPAYYNKRRPEPSGIPTTLTYGGKYFNLELTKDDLFGNTANAKAVSVVVIRTGFSTHAINFGQRLVELDHTFTTKSDGGVTLHVSQVPPNAAMLQPGPACTFDFLSSQKSDLLTLFFKGSSLLLMVYHLLVSK